MLAQTVTKGTAPTLSVLVDPATNRITTGGYSYDSNGNLTAMPLLTMSYDIENRLTQAISSLNGTERYVYDPGNQRVWKEGKVYFYGVEGNLLGTYGDGANSDYNVYFGGKLVWQEAAAGLAAHPVNSDRLASTVKHFPYGEEPTTTQTFTATMLNPEGFAPMVARAVMVYYPGYGGGYFGTWGHWLTNGGVRTNNYFFNPATGWTQCADEPVYKWQ